MVLLNFLALKAYLLKQIRNIEILEVGVGDGAMGRGIVRNRGVYKGKLRDPRAEAKLGQFKSSLGRPGALSKNALFVWDQRIFGAAGG